MPNARFIHVGFAVGGQVPVDKLVETFNKATDWLRYEAHCWILYTTTDIDTWRDRIRNTPGIKESDSFFLCEFNPFAAGGYTGYMEDWVWNWMAKRKTS